MKGVEESVLKGLIGKRQAGELWANKLGIAYLDPIQSVITDDALSLIPEEIARKAGVLPLYFLNNVLTVSTSEPKNEEQLRRLKFICGHEVSPIFAFPSEIRDAIEIHYASEEDVSSFIKRFQEQNKGILENLDELELEHMAESEMLANIVDSILHFGIKEGASDIHIEPMETKCRVRFRVDGRLREILSFNKSLHPALASRVKILCKLDIAEKRFPQQRHQALALREPALAGALNVLARFFLRQGQEARHPATGDRQPVQRIEQAGLTGAHITAHGQDPQVVRAKLRREPAHLRHLVLCGLVGARDPQCDDVAREVSHRAAVHRRRDLLP